MERRHSRSALSLDDCPVLGVAVRIGNEGIKCKCPCPEIHDCLSCHFVLADENLVANLQQRQGMPGSLFHIEVGVHLFTEIQALDERFLGGIASSRLVDIGQEIAKPTIAPGSNACAEPPSPGDHPQCMTPATPTRSDVPAVVLEA